MCGLLNSLNKVYNTNTNTFFVNIVCISTNQTYSTDNAPRKTRLKLKKLLLSNIQYQSLPNSLLFVFAVRTGHLFLPPVVHLVDHANVRMTHFTVAGLLHFAAMGNVVIVLVQRVAMV